MPVGKSNRIVIDVDNVDLKRRMYSALAEDGHSLKEWFVAAATEYLETRVYSRQLPLPSLRAAEPVATYAGKSEPKAVVSQKESNDLSIPYPATRRRSRN